MEQLPAVNAALNGLAAILLVAAYVAIRKRRIQLHQTLMMAAFCTSVLFLACYLYYHIVVKSGVPTYFTTPGWPKAAYFTILISHTVLAVAVAVLAPVTLYLGFGAPRNRHTKIARWTFPIWLYVSVTGVVVYVMLYHLYPPAAAAGTTSG
jgi:putative membrane protein